MEKEKFIRCDCHSEFVRVVYDKEFAQFDLSIWSLQATSKPSWRTKLSWIWRIIKHGSPYGDQIIIDKDKAKELAEYLTNVEPSCPTQQETQTKDSDAE